jgi:predicted flap endonuclease-1-like 5' DNA nuclease
MAKTTPLTLADLNMSLGKADIKMNPAIAAQLKDVAGGAASSDVQLTKGLGPNLEKNLNNLANAE